MTISGILAANARNWSSRAVPADEAAISALNVAAGFELPPDYLEFLRFSNGGNGDLCIWPGLFSIWPAEKVAENNIGYGFPEFAPHFFAFGTDGADSFLAFDRRRDDGAVYLLDFIISEDNAREVSHDFEMFAMACGIPYSSGDSIAP